MPSIDTADLPEVARIARDLIRFDTTNYGEGRAKGEREAAEYVGAFLAELGNPYDAVGADADGRTSIDWGVYGVPETFIVDAKGVIRFKHTGPLALGDIDREIVPALARAAKS